MLALRSQKMIELWATQLSELLNLQEIKGTIIHLWFVGVLRQTMQGKRMVKSGYPYAFPLYWIERDGAPWKGPVRKHVSQACLSVGSSSSTWFCLLLSVCLQQEFLYPGCSENNTGAWEQSELLLTPLLECGQVDRRVLTASGMFYPQEVNDEF